MFNAFRDIQKQMQNQFQKQKQKQFQKQKTPVPAAEDSAVPEAEVASVPAAVFQSSSSRRQLALPPPHAYKAGVRRGLD